MQQVILLASSAWIIIEKQQRDSLEKHYLKLANFLMTEKLQGRQAHAIWFCSSPLLSDTLAGFMGDYKIPLEIITLPPSPIEIDFTLQLNTEETNSHYIQRLEEDFWEDLIPYKISEHTFGALEVMPPTALNGLPVCFTGNMENGDLSYLEECGLIDAYIEQLPVVFQNHANSLIATCIGNIGTDEPWGAINGYKLKLLCFAKLLHGFVCITQFDSNNFDVVETVKSLEIDDLYLGGKLSSDIFDDIFLYDAEEYDLHDVAYGSIVNNNIYKFTQSLSKYMGINYLYVLLWWCIWPCFTQSVYDKYDNLLNNINLNDDESITRLEVYEFLQDGWSDRADNN